MRFKIPRLLHLSCFVFRFREHTVLTTRERLFKQRSTSPAYLNCMQAFVDDYALICRELFWECLKYCKYDLYYLRVGLFWYFMRKHSINQMQRHLSVTCMSLFLILRTSYKEIKCLVQWTQIYVQFFLCPGRKYGPKTLQTIRI